MWKNLQIKEQTNNGAYTYNTLLQENVPEINSENCDMAKTNLHKACLERTILERSFIFST